MRAVARGACLAALVFVEGAFALAGGLEPPTPSPAPAVWGGDGHRIVGRIAEGLLSQAARDGVRELLGNRSLPSVANWADEVRDDPAYKWSKPLHYVNAPEGADEIDMVDHCPANQCVIGAIRYFTDLLKDGSARQDQRERALKFLVHFVGDIHQPLHAGHASDLGANAIDVRIDGATRNLHAVWDASVVDRARGDMTWWEFADTLSDFYGDEARARWRASTDPLAWADESLAWAAAVAYDYPADGVLTEAYLAEAERIVRERLVTAGVRLAALLNGVFAERSPSAAAEED